MGFEAFFCFIAALAALKWTRVLSWVTSHEDGGGGSAWADFTFVLKEFDHETVKSIWQLTIR